MAYNEELEISIKKILIKKNVDFLEKKMFGGLAFMINNKMCFGIIKNDLMLRVLDHEYEGILHNNRVRPIDFTGRTMKGFFY